MQEEFRDVIGYEGLYQISNLGNVKSLPREVCNHLGCHILKERILKPGVNGSGYLMVVLNDKSIKTKRIHKLVAETFLSHKSNGQVLVVDHINNNKLDNRLENLQIITNRENLSKDKKGSSKYAGVSWHKPSKKWRSRLYFNGINIYLGIFKTELEASNVYQNKLKELQLC